MTNTFNELYRHELELLASAEGQMITLLPRLVAGTATTELRYALEKHVEGCLDQRDMVRHLIKELGSKASIPVGLGIKALVEECSILLKDFPSGNLRDAAVIAHLQRAEHYKIASYASVRDFAKLLGDKAATEALGEALQATTAMSKDLGAIAIQINAEAYVDTREEGT